MPYAGIAVVVSYPSDPEDKRVFCCPACLLEKETPVGLATHMSKHDSLVGMTACFGTAKFQTKTRQTHVIKAAERKIELPPEAPSQPERKRPKPSTGTTASLMDVIKQQQEQQNKLIDLMKVRDQKMSDSNKVRDEHLTKALAQTDKMLNAQQTTLQAMVNITNGIGSPSLDAAEEQQMRLNAFKENAGHIS